MGCCHCSARGDEDESYDLRSVDDPANGDALPWLPQCWSTAYCATSRVLEVSAIDRGARRRRRPRGPDHSGPSSAADSASDNGSSSATGRGPNHRRLQDGSSRSPSPERGIRVPTSPVVARPAALGGELAVTDPATSLGAAERLSSSSLGDDSMDMWAPHMRIRELDQLSSLSSDGDFAEEPNGCVLAMNRAARVTRARFQFGVNDDPRQYTAPEEPPTVVDASVRKVQNWWALLAGFAGGDAGGAIHQQQLQQQAPVRSGRPPRRAPLSLDTLQLHERLAEWQDSRITTGGGRTGGATPTTAPVTTAMRPGGTALPELSGWSSAAHFNSPLEPKSPAPRDAMRSAPLPVPQDNC